MYDLWLKKVFSTSSRGLVKYNNDITELLLDILSVCDGDSFATVLLLEY